MLYGILTTGALALIFASGAPGSTQTNEGDMPTQSLEADCAKNPKLFNARLIGSVEEQRLFTILDNDFASVVGSDIPFEISGPCSRTLKSVGRVIHLTYSDVVLIPDPDGLRIGAYEDEPPQKVSLPPPDEIKKYSPSGTSIAGELRMVQWMELPGISFAGLWRGENGSVVEVTKCDKTGHCLQPRPLIVSQYQIRDLRWEPLPHGPSEVLGFWVHISPSRDAIISLVVGDHRPS